MFKLPHSAKASRARDLRRVMHAANERYPAFMASIDNPQAGQKAVAKMAAPAKVKGRSLRGFNLFLDPDYRLFPTLARGEWAISGFRAADLRAHFEDLSPGPSLYLSKRLLTNGLIKKLAHTDEHQLTALGRHLLVTTLILLECFVQPVLAGNEP